LAAHLIAVSLLSSCRVPASLDFGDLGSRKAATLMVFSKSNKMFELTGTPLRGLKEVVDGSGGIVDPTLALAERLAADFARAHELSLVQLPMDRSDYFASEYGGQPRRGADLLLDLMTTDMGVNPVPWQTVFQTSPLRFAVHFEANMNLIDLRDHDLLVSRDCVGDDPRIARARKARSLEQARALTADFPTAAELEVDGAQRLRSELAQAVARCLADFRSKGLRLRADDSAELGNRLGAARL
jgi:hypothetical protein